MSRSRVDLTPYLAQIEQLAGLGLDQQEIALVLGVSHDTLTRRKRDTAAVAEAIARGRARAAGAVGKALLDRARQGDLAAIQYWERTRAGRVDPERAPGAGAGGGAAVTIQILQQQVQSGIAAIWAERRGALLPAPAGASPIALPSPDDEDDAA